MRAREEYRLNHGSKLEPAGQTCDHNGCAFKNRPPAQDIAMRLDSIAQADALLGSSAKEHAARLFAETIVSALWSRPTVAATGRTRWLEWRSTNFSPSATLSRSLPGPSAPFAHGSTPTGSSPSRVAISGGLGQAGLRGRSSPGSSACQPAVCAVVQSFAVRTDARSAAAAATATTAESREPSIPKRRRERI